MQLSEVRNMLRINRHRLDDELEIQADVLDRIGREVALHNSRMLEAKKELAVTEARVIERLKEDDPKMSNPLAEKAAARDREYTEAWQKYQQARHLHEEWESAYKAWHARGFDIKALGELFAHQYFTISEVRGPYPENTQSIRSRVREASEQTTARRSTREPAEEEQPTRPRRRTLVDQ